MDRYTISEFLYRFRVQEPAVKVLVVEGVNDAKFWARLAPPTSRTDATVMPIGYVDIPAGDGGERGRALRLAEIIAESDLIDRVKFFLDADETYLLSDTPTAPVELTDFRDLEGYACEVHELEIIGESSGANPTTVTHFLRAVASIGVRIASLRASAKALNLELPINSTLERNPRRFFRYAPATGLAFNEGRFLQILFSSGRGNGCRDHFVATADDIEATATKLDFRKAVRGKDIHTIGAQILGIDRSQIGMLMFNCLLCNCSQKLHLPNLQRAHQHIV